MICGVGITGYGKYSHRNNTKMYKCWSNMIMRCYNKGRKFKAYYDCLVCDEWLDFQTFGAWYEVNYIEGYHLDKDIIKPGNKIYSPENCCFVSQDVNKFFTFGGNGIKIEKSGRFSANIKYRKIQIRIGTYDTECEANENYNAKKIEFLREYISKEPSDRISNGMLKHIKVIEDSSCII